MRIIRFSGLPRIYIMFIAHLKNVLDSADTSRNSSVHLTNKYSCRKSNKRL